MKENFGASLVEVLKYEGGFVDHPDDEGGPTNQGVTLKTFRAYYGEHMTADDLKKISYHQVRSIYEQGYWKPCRCDDLPVGIDFVVFDQAVHSGPKQSAQWLQRAVNVYGDGVIGPVTLEAVERVIQELDIPVVIERMTESRIIFLAKLPSWQTFRDGWVNRIHSAKKFGYALLHQKEDAEEIEVRIVMTKGVAAALRQIAQILLRELGPVDK